MESGECRFREVRRVERGRKWEEMEGKGMWEKKEETMGRLLEKIKNDVNKMN